MLEGLGNANERAIWILSDWVINPDVVLFYQVLPRRLHGRRDTEEPTDHHRTQTVSRTSL